MKKSIMFALFVLGLSSFSVSADTGAVENLKTSIKPDTITIGTFYNGTEVTASGLIPNDCEAVAVFSGERRELHLKEKGKALGLFWMNMGTLTYEGVPNVFLVSSPKKVTEMGGPAAEGSQGVADIGLDGLSRSITVDSKKSDPKAMIGELFKLKKHDGLYQEQTGSVTYSQSEQGFKSFQLKIGIPSRLSPGKYTVSIYCVRNGQIVAKNDHVIAAKLVDTPQMLAGLAFGRSLLYGILATLIAIAGGLIIGFVFQGSKGGAH